MWDEPNVELKCQNVHSYRYQKRCWLIQTEGRWPWKLESAKECVTTHLPNQLALKMDGAKVYYLYSTFWTNYYFMFRRVEGRGVSVEVYERELGWKKL